jgi:VIT1/CCC1 family predicted Fe2+/Mn2+ transporter
MYLMSCLAERARALATWRAVRSASTPEKGHRRIAAALPSAIATMIGPSVLEEIRQQVIRGPEPAVRPRLSWKDWVGAAAVFLLVFLSTFPVVLPFVFMGNALRAQRFSNLIAIGMLFITGYAFGHCTGYHPRGMGLVMVVLGGSLVGLTILLGG